MPITVLENSGSTLSNYQLKLYVDTQTLIAAGKMQSNGADILFGSDCPGNTLLNHWVEGPINDDSTAIWVKVPTIPANGTTTIYMFFGNPTATSASAISGTFIGPHSSTDSVASGGAGGVGNSQRGFRFAPTQDILVESFGKREPTGTARYVTLFNFSTQAILRQQQVSGPAAQYSYSALAQPIWLTTGTQYVLQLFQGASDGYYFGTSSQIGQHLQYFDMKYCNSCTQNTFPTNTLTNYHYGYPDLWYFTKQNVSPAPSYTIGAGLDVALADINACEGQLLTLSSNVTGNTGQPSCSWTPSAGLSSATDCNPTMVLDSSTYYVLTVTDTLGCRISDSLWITNGSPEVTEMHDSTVICAGDTVLLQAFGADFFTWGPGGSLSSLSGDSVWAFPTSSTVYSVIGTDSASGCTDTTLLQVNVSPVSVVVVLGPLNMCEGDSLMISVSGADTYSWSPGSSLNDSTSSTVIATPSSDVTYTITGYDTLNGCSATNGVMVLVHPLPVVTFDLPFHFCDLDPPVQLTTGSPVGGGYSGPGVTNPTFSPSVAGPGTHILTYNYYDLFGCEASDTALAIVDICVAVTPTLNVDLSVYPNPTTGALTVVMGDSPEATHFKIMNNLGQMVREGELNVGANQLDLSGQSAGLYVLIVEVGEARKAFNIQLQR